MKHGKKPTRAQKVRIGKAGLSPENWLVVKNCPDGAMVVLHKYTNRVRVIPASITPKDREGEQMNEQISIKGQAVADAVLAKAPDGGSVATFRLSVTKSGKQSGYDGDTVNVVAYGERAEYVGDCVKKDVLVIVEGSLQERHYTDKDGIKRKAVEMIAEDVYYCGPKLAPTV